MIAWRSTRLRQFGLTRIARAYVLGSMVFLALSWAAASAAVAGSVLMEEPWPLSMLQGPDTSRAREVFHRNFGVEPSVSQVYARVDWAGTMHIAFSFEDAAVVERIVGRRALLPVPSRENARSAWQGRHGSHPRKRSRRFPRYTETTGPAVPSRRSCGSIASGVACFSCPSDSRKAASLRKRISS